MTGKLAEFVLTLVAPRRRRCADSSPSLTAGAHAFNATRAASRSLCDALDRAMELGLWEHAERLAQAAARLAHQTPRLCERLARLRLAQGRAETALAVIDGCRPLCASLRLLRAACLIQLGRATEAQMDLRVWSMKSTAPLAARRLLALLEWDAGDSQGAQATLTRNLRHLEDPQTLEILLVMAAAQERSSLAEQWADRLRSASLLTKSGLAPEILLPSIGMPAPTEPAMPTAAQVEMLAVELLGMEPVIPTLVAAQHVRVMPEQASLLYGALEKALPELANPALAHEALARLALVLNDREAAAQWAERGLALHPMSAPLALLLEESRRRPVAPAQRDQAAAALGEEVLGSIGEDLPSREVARVTGRAA